MPALLDVDSLDRIVPSSTPSTSSTPASRSSPGPSSAPTRAGRAQAGFYYYFDPQGRAIKKDSDMYKALDVLAKEVGIKGIFSDWPATVTYYANCMGLD